MRSDDESVNLKNQFIKQINDVRDRIGQFNEFNARQRSSDIIDPKIAQVSSAKLFELYEEALKTNNSHSSS